MSCTIDYGHVELEYEARSCENRCDSFEEEKDCGIVCGTFVEELVSFKHR